MNEKYYVVFDGKSVIGTDENAWEDNDGFKNYWWFDDSWFDSDVFLTRAQVIDVLEFYTALNGKNVYEFLGDPEELSDTANAVYSLNNIGDYTNAELIEKLKMEENSIDQQEKEHDAVKRPSHYMLEDGTEVKNHIRSILGDDGFKSWAIGNAIKYVSRYKDKGKPVQDLKKAQENIQMVIDVLEH